MIRFRPGRRVAQTARLTTALAAALAATSALTGCYGDMTVEAQARAVSLEAPEPSWRAATPDDLDGFFESTRLTGETAGAVLKTYYQFAPDGDYSGAALVLSDEGPRFLVIAEEGRWTLDREGLDLHDGSGKLELYAARASAPATPADGDPDPVPEASPEAGPERMLKLVSPRGAIVMRRVELR